MALIAADGVIVRIGHHDASVVDGVAAKQHLGRSDLVIDAHIAAVVIGRLEGVRDVVIDERRGLRQWVEIDDLRGYGIKPVRRNDVVGERSPDVGASDLP